jgi:outer membrane efflux protein
LMSAFRDALELGSPKKLKRFKASLARSGLGDLEVLELLVAEGADTVKPSPTPHKSSRTPLANTRAAQYKLLRSRAYLRQVVHQTTHSLARGFLEVDASYKGYAKAKGLRNKAEKRLAAQQARWEEGRITPDRFLDAVDQYAAAVTAEHQCLAAYNYAIAFLSECKGTLLEDDNIIVAEPRRRDQTQQTAQRAQDDQARKTSFTPTTTPSHKPTFLEVWQASTSPWLTPYLLAKPDENVGCCEGTSATKD